MGTAPTHLSARVSSDNPAAIEPVLVRWLGGGGTVRPTPDGFEVAADLGAGSARDLNRELLTELRRAEKRTRLRSEWTADGVTERFFDYVPKGRRPAVPSNRP
ncbi:MAG TPA: hypothetical protein VMI55_05405 [Thermoplasmata archaeon]|nr:hypothetical protein [Thermoplasmata archaeon]